MKNLVFRIAGVTNDSVVDGVGLRSTIFFQGCPHHCPGCHNPETWQMDTGQEVSFVELLTKLKLSSLTTGVTFSGGEPFLQAKNAAILAAYLKHLHLNIWVYTGYTWEYLINNLENQAQQLLLNYIDVLVDGPFIVQQQQTGLIFRGSTNQRLIKVKESLALGRVVQWQLGELEAVRWVG